MEAGIKQTIDAVRWYHRFEVLPGVWTPGIVPFDAAAILDELGVPANLSGKRALDVGTWDGPLAFELEARGASVCAIDVQDPDCTAFNTARALRKSRVEYSQLSIYDINKAFAEKFDIITCFGVYYHLKHPLLGFEALSEALAPGSRLYFEGELLINYSETQAGKPSALNNHALAESDVPLALCYTGCYKDASNWFVPNLTCLKGWLEACGLELDAYQLRAARPSQRILGIAGRARDLEVVPEIGIFKKNLELPTEWVDQFHGLLNRRRSAAPHRIPRPSIVSRALRRVLRAVR
jgi:tRNA (mo5U34)-methyltransferase